jgi:exosortase
MVILIGLVLWSYLPTLERIAVRWQDDPRYSHGYFVPLFAAVLLWTRRSRWSAPRPSAWGLVLLASASLLRLTAALVYFDWLDAVSLLPCLAGLAVLLGGRALWNWAWPAILFLSFMLPLPHQLEVGLAGPLQRLATLISVYALQTLGFPALAQGNIILIEELRIGVLEACSGLGMLVTFFALSTAFAIVVDRPLLDRIVLFLSAAPIGVLANVLRITVTVVLHRTAGSEVANAVFHDLAGWFMMPLAVALLWFELRLLDRLFIPTETRLAGLYLARATDRD